MNELSAFERRLASSLEAVAGPPRSIDAIAIARSAASRAPVRRTILSRVSVATALAARIRGRRLGERTEGPGARPLVVLIAVALIAVLALGALAVGSGLVRMPSVAPSPPDTVSPSVVPLQLTAPTTWTDTGNPVEMRFGETATVLPNGDVLLVGGNPQFGRRQPSRASAELYDPNTGRWTLTGSMYEARQDHAAVLLESGDVLVLGGNAFRAGQDRLLSSSELYDPRSGAWTETGRLTTARTNPTSTLLTDGRVLVVGGASSRSDGPENTAELYDPVTGHWTRTASMSVARSGHTATPLPDGKVLVAGGGCCDPAAQASAELYDPASRTWAPTGALGSGRAFHAAVLLADGKVLVYGGDNRRFDATVTTAELYDPSTGEWAGTASPDLVGNLFETQGGGGGGQAVRLPDGKVLAVAFGVAGEAYDPASGSWTAVGGLSDGEYTYVHTSSLLVDGQVLVTSERWPTAGGGPQPVAALFDPRGTP